jgi:predicted PurR-regulated permease PerM
MMLVGLFFMLVEGPRFVQWIVGISPLTEDQTTELLADFRDVSNAVLVGSVGTALVQTIVALFGYWIAGAHHALLLATATFIGAFIPVVGAGSVVVASAVVLFFTGHSNQALFLAIWGIGVVASIDNFVKPYLMRGRLEVNTGVIFFALLGGAATFGPIGLLAGPLVVSFFLAVVRMCKKELSDGRLRMMTLATIPPGKIPMSALAAAAAAAVGVTPTASTVFAPESAPNPNPAPNPGPTPTPNPNPARPASETIPEKS